MRPLGILVVASIAMCGAALGQTNQGANAPARIEGPWGTLEVNGFERRPTGRDFANNFPGAALERGMGGSAILCCRPKPDRTLDCRVGVEWPTSEWKFGAASLRIAETFQLTPAAYDTIMMHPDAELRLPIRWNVDGGDRRYRRSLQRAADIMSAAPVCRGDRRVTSLD